MSEIASWLGLAPWPKVSLAPNTNVSRSVSAFRKNDKCRAWCQCGWESRERNLTDENIRKATEDTWRHHRAKHGGKQ